MSRNMSKRFLPLMLAVGILLSGNPDSAAQDKLRKSVTWENINLSAPNLPELGNLVTVPSSLERQSLWSVGCETLDRDYSDFANYKQYVGETGVGYARLQSGWAKTEKKKGKYDFAWIDAHVDGLIAQGVHPWICLCYGNPLYSDHGIDLNAALFDDGPIMDGWLNYVKATVKHFKGKVTMYEVWNEPDNKKTGLDNWPLYANLFVRTAKAIREVDPDVKIAGFGAVSPDHLYLRKAVGRIVELGGGDYLDYLTFHTYWPIPEYVIEPVKDLQRFLAETCPHTKLLQGETGCPGQLEYGHAMSGLEWTEYSQAKWDLRQMLNHFSLGIPYSVFTMVDLHYKDYMLQSFGLIRMRLNNVPVYKRPKFYAVQHVTSFFDETVTPDTTVTVKSLCGRKICCTGLKKGGKTVGCVLWMGDEMPSSSLERQEVSLTVEGVSFDKPVYLDLLSGKVYDIPLAKIKGAGAGTNYDSAFNPKYHVFSKLPLWDSPIVLINRDDFKWNK